MPDTDKRMESATHTRPGGGEWQFWIDRGGTFTDIVAKSPDGKLHAQKLLSENKTAYDDAVIAGINAILGLAHDYGTPKQATQSYESISAVKMGTTVATNALLERTGEPTALLITRGFGDALRIGYQQRPALFDREIRLPAPLYCHVLEVDERLDADGQVLKALDEVALRKQLIELWGKGLRSVAIVLMHGYRYHAHELRAAAIASEAGFSQVSVSHEVGALARLVPRGDTTVADAYLSPVLRRYIDKLANQLGNTRLLFMQSHGGLAEARFFRGRDSILSGPAGGVVGMVATAKQAGFDRLVGFDMGGTSTDVSLFSGSFERTLDNRVAGARIQAPMMRIHTVAAGGGSLLDLVDGRFQVGPDSAGADPGPSCYRNGGPLTVTDANLLLGRIQARWFPRVFGPTGTQSLDALVVAERFGDLARRVELETGKRLAAEEIAAGYLRIAVDRMAQAIKQISTQRGHDVTEFTLCCFGGAGGQHACDVADALGIRTVLIHPLAGVLSAYGMGLADLRFISQRTVEKTLNDITISDLESDFRETDEEAITHLKNQGAEPSTIRLTRRLQVRYDGTDTPIEVPFGTAQQVSEVFDDLHVRQFGFSDSRRKIIQSLSVEAISPGESIGPVSVAPTGVSDHAPLDDSDVYSGGTWHSTPTWRRTNLPVDRDLAGPLLVIEDNSTTFVAPGWQGRVDKSGDLLLRRLDRASDDCRASTEADPIMLEVFNNLFMHIAEQMGVVLEKTAHSVNIKERLDFSCALFDTSGGLVANAPHMPVHLGSMGESVRAVIRQFTDRISPGDSFVLNAPYDGGTHLPDVTVVSPYFAGSSPIPTFFVASRAHHADIGGMTPGSMPPDSTRIDQEGILIPPSRLVRDGQLLESELLAQLAAGQWPARNPRQNIADLKAQLAANAKGLAEIEAMIRHFGFATVTAYMGHVQDNAEEAVRTAISSLRSGGFRYSMDNGETIGVDIQVDAGQRSVIIDFGATSGQSPTNFNAPLAVCRAAVLYVFRTLVDHDIPMNEGCLRPITINVPTDCLLNPAAPAAVVAGNVETSQCIVDALYGALGVMAAAQGTMNNLTFGNERYQYYETICGGAGAGPDFDGASAVHTHMTNSRLTDPEVLESRYPVVLKRFELRTGSGGAGEHKGGEGVIREIEFVETMTAAILSNHRRIAPFGMSGGEPGKPGINRVRRADGRVEVLSATAEIAVAQGDSLVIKTPGGGGYGRAT
jgi:5-oxoprolinase (ATP-hydrolysing)